VLRELFDAIWVYGDPAVHDGFDACGASGLRDLVTYTGYLAVGREATPGAVAPPSAGPYVLCMVGGGADGAELARSFARAVLPSGTTGVLVTGPQMPGEDRRDVERLAATRPDLVVVSFTPDLPQWICRAHAVVSMGGYNSVSEILGTATPALIVPRRAPRREQTIRALALASVGAVDTLAPDRADAAGISRWLARTDHRVGRGHLRLDGLDQLPRLTERLLVREVNHATL